MTFHEWIKEKELGPLLEWQKFFADIVIAELENRFKDEPDKHIILMLLTSFVQQNEHDMTL